MEKYIEQIKFINEIFEKCNFSNGIKCCSDQIEANNLNVGVIGINLTDNAELISKISSRVSNIEFKNLKLKNEGEELNFDTGCHIIIQVIDAVQPVTKGDYNLYKNLSKYYNHIIFIIDRMKYIDKDEIDDLKYYIKDKLNTFNKSNNVFYSEDENSFLKLMGYLKKINDSHEVKNSSNKFKLKALSSEGINFIKSNINLLENWESEKQKRIEIMSKKISELLFYGEGFTLYFNRYEERVKKYISSFGKEDTKYIEHCFSDLLSCVQIGFKKYLKLPMEYINSLNLKDDKYSLIPASFVEELRLITKKNIQRIIKETNECIQNLKNKPRDEEYFEGLKQSISLLISFKEELENE